ncbi:MAG: hypothetical protein WD072_01280, partial [Pirellulales bacterium]
GSPGTPACREDLAHGAARARGRRAAPQHPAHAPRVHTPRLTGGTARGPDFLAAAGGLALVVLGLRVLYGGRRREPGN